MLNSRVVGVRDGHVSVVNKAGEESEIAFGACVWATGIAMNPLVKEIQQAYPETQTHFRCGCAAMGAPRPTSDVACSLGCAVPGRWQPLATQEMLAPEGAKQPYDMLHMLYQCGC